MDVICRTLQLRTLIGTTTSPIQKLDIPDSQIIEDLLKKKKMTLSKTIQDNFP